ncbi:AtpZ/AtpI family protein [Candidatus Gottesmanbacteria bacterium]|nr:AtpZ/AtpI family protein [Candidatus Gottesmanbacteria bacterium]MBI5465613.1 AtpZ/AtpI family protein [Candidatus Gottesmanbacteria bacterium]
MVKKKFLRFTQEKKLEPVEEEVVEKKESNRKFLGYLSVAFELGFTISLPIAGGALLGQFLDARLQTSPRMTLSLIFLGLMVAGFYIYSLIKESR